MIKQAKNKERRQYIRLDSVFPVDFRLVAQDNRAFLSDWIQGFTNNISRGGICLSVNNLKTEFVELIQKGKAGLMLNIQIPLSTQVAAAWARPTWIEPAATQPGQYLIGLNYTKIAAAANRRIMGYAWTKYLIPRISAGLVIILTLGVGISGYFNWRLTRENRNLVSRLIRVSEESRAAQDIVNKISKQREELNFRLEQVQGRIRDAEQEKRELSQQLNQMQLEIERGEFDKQAVSQDVRQLALLIKQLETERSALQKELLELQRKESQAAEDLSVLDEKKAALRQASFDNMYQWLAKHQNPHSGLISSFEGDENIANWAFTYDQALAACAYAYSADFQKAKNIFNFFQQQARRAGGGFLNAYYAKDGQPAEWVVHSGPNIWLGIAIMQYTQMSQDKRYLALAEAIGKWIIKIQSQDKDGGIRGGPEIEWYATEHNLDAYAFLNMLYKLTGNSRYKDSAQRVLQWLLSHTYDRPDVPIRRGKGDSTIATDTYAWSIAALGPAKLEEIGMSADDIMKFAEDQCCVAVDYSRPDGRVIEVKGFDFSAQRHLARGGVVSCEWTAQMILSFKIMAEFYREKQIIERAEFYQRKADDYLWQLSRMIISSSSPSGQGRGCLPYASSQSADTGHGWVTPKGSSTGSVAATAYTFFAYHGFNPLQLDN